MKRALGALLPLWLWACEPAPLPAPSIVSVVPEQVPAGFSSALSVKVSAALPLVVDYQSEAIDAEQLALTVELAGQEVDIPFADRDGLLIVPVPEGLAPGDYDIRVSLADGRSASRERAFSVVPTPAFTGESDGGMQEDGGAGGILVDIPDRYVGFRFDPIEDQVRGAQFQVTLRAYGPAAETFQEPVKLRASKGMVRTHTAGSFARGVQVEQISLSHPGLRVYLLAEDAKGRKALSNSFRVRSH
jgi:hypothetical protein